MSMHRFIMGAVKGQCVDHINGDRLDNRRANLRFATSTQNNVNRPPRKSASVYKGLKRTRGRWVAQIRVDGRQTYLGMFESEIDAARAYDKAAFALHGEFAWLNFPEMAQ